MMNELINFSIKGRQKKKQKEKEKKKRTDPTCVVWTSVIA